MTSVHPLQISLKLGTQGSSHLSWLVWSYTSFLQNSESLLNPLKSDFQRIFKCSLEADCLPKSLWKRLFAAGPWSGRQLLKPRSHIHFDDSFFVFFAWLSFKSSPSRYSCWDQINCQISHPILARTGSNPKSVCLLNSLLASFLRRVHEFFWRLLWDQSVLAWSSCNKSSP